MLHRLDSPQSLQDSGVEDQCDMSIVPAESLGELLMRAFRLTQQKYFYYVQKCADMYTNKSPERVRVLVFLLQNGKCCNNNTKKIDI